MSPVHGTLGREEVAALVCSTLERHGVKAVLCGGAVVSIYSANEFESFDLDFVIPGLFRKVGPAMEELGFEKSGRHWRHPASRFWVEFPPGPVQVGDDVVHDFVTRDTPHGRLVLLAPSDCVMDRLAGYFHWNDPQCLEQAIAVARRHPIDLDRIRSWARRERVQDRLTEFVDRIEEPG